MMSNRRRRILEPSLQQGQLPITSNLNTEVNSRPITVEEGKSRHDCGTSKSIIEVSDNHIEIKSTPIDSEVQNTDTVDTDTSDTPQIVRKKYSRQSKEERKLNRNFGEEYVTSEGKVVPRKKCQDLSNCRMKCSSRLSSQDRQAVFNEMWGLGSFDMRVGYVASLIETAQKATMRLRPDVDEDKRKFRFQTHKYFLCFNSARVAVCKGCFIKTLGITDRFVRTCLLKKVDSVGGVTAPDMRGKAPSKRKWSPEDWEKVKAQINSFSVHESHYIRKRTT